MIADILIDAYSHGEALMGFENAFDESGCFPYRRTVVGEDTEIRSDITTNGRHELIAAGQCAGRRHPIAVARPR